MKLFKRFSILDQLFAISSIIVILLFVIVLISRKNVRGVGSNVVYSIERILSDNNALYENVREAPYSLTQYAPLYYMISDFNLSILNISPKNNGYWLRILLRFQNLLFFALLAFFGIKLIEHVRQTRLSLKEKWLFILLLTGFTAPWYFVTRPDVLVSLFFVISTYFLIKGIERKMMLYVFIAGFVSVLAFLAKQNGLLILLFIWSLLLVRLRFYSFVYFTLGAISSGGVFLIVYYFSGYSMDWIAVNLIDGIDNGIDIKKALNNALLPFISLFGFPLLIILAQAVDKRKIIIMNFGLLYIFLFLFLSLGAALVTSIKIGSAINYFNDSIIFAIILSFALFRKKIPEKIMLIAILFSISLGVLQLVKYSPRSLYFTFASKHSSELSYSKPFVESLDNGSFFFTNIRNLMLDYPDQCTFPQFEIFGSAISSTTANPIYKEVIENIDYSHIDLLIIDASAYYLPLDLTKYKLIDTYNDIKVYKKN